MYVCMYVFWESVFIFWESVFIVHGTKAKTVATYTVKRWPNMCRGQQTVVPPIPSSEQSARKCMRSCTPPIRYEIVCQIPALCGGLTPMNTWCARDCVTYRSMATYVCGKVDPQLSVTFTYIPWAWPPQGDLEPSCLSGNDYEKCGTHTSTYWAKENPCIVKSPQERE